MAQKQPQDAYVRRGKELASQVQRLRGWIATDPSRMPELVDALIALTRHRLLGHAYAEAAIESQESVVAAARLVTAAGPIGPYTSMLDAARYVTATVQVATIQVGLDLDSAARQTVDAVLSWKLQLPGGGQDVLVEPLTMVWALMALARGSLAEDDVAKANAWADAAYQRFADSGLEEDQDLWLVVLDLERLISDCRWAAGLPDEAINHLDQAIERYEKLAADALLQPGSVGPARLERLIEPAFGLYRDAADRLVANGQINRGLQTRRYVIRLLENVSSRGGDSVKAQLAGALSDLATDLRHANRMDEAREHALESTRIASQLSRPGRQTTQPPALSIGTMGVEQYLRERRREIGPCGTSATPRWDPVDADSLFTVATGDKTGTARRAVTRPHRTGGPGTDPATAKARSQRLEDQARQLESGIQNHHRKLEERREADRLAQEQSDRARRETDRQALARAEEERRNAAQANAARLAAREEAARQETKRLRQARIEAHRLEAERVEAERLATERRAASPVDKERLELERLEAELAELERQEAESAALDRQEERLEAERAELAELERLEAERAELERLEAERAAELEQQAAERAVKLEQQAAGLELKEPERQQAEPVELEQLQAPPAAGQPVTSGSQGEPDEGVPPDEDRATDTDDLAAARRAWHDATQSGDRLLTRAAIERVVELLRPMAAADLETVGPELVLALDELAAAYRQTGDWWGSRGPAKEAKALAKSLRRP